LIQRLSNRHKRASCLVSIILGGTAPIFFAVAAAAAQPVSELSISDPWNVTVGLGPGIAPRYLGSKSKSFTPIPVVRVVWKNRIFVSSIDGVGIYAFNTPSFKMGASIGLGGDTRYHGGNGNLRGLPSIKIGGLASIFATYNYNGLSINLAAHQRIGVVNGISVDLGADYTAAITPKLTITAGPSVTYADSKLNEAYFGITSQQSEAAARLGNNLRPYHVGAGIQDVSLNFSSRYSFDQNWSLTGIIKLAMLVGNDANSPVVQQKFQPFVGVIVSYHF